MKRVGKCVSADNAIMLVVDTAELILFYISYKPFHQKNPIKIVETYHHIYCASKERTPNSVDYYVHLAV